MRADPIPSLSNIRVIRAICGSTPSRHRFPIIQSAKRFAMHSTQILDIFDIFSQKPHVAMDIFVATFDYLPASSVNSHARCCTPRNSLTTPLPQRQAIPPLSSF
jgi:hypothetical protein